MTALPTLLHHREPLGDPKPMRIVVHDYAGHPFQVQLSRELAGRGHDVVHLYCGSVTTGQGDLGPRASDPAGLRIEPLVLDSTFARYAAAKRLRQEVVYGRMLARRALAFTPDVVVSSNTPLLAQRHLLRSCARRGVGTVFWQQDVLGVGIKRVLARKHRMLGAVAGNAFVGIERRALQRSDAVVAISEDFVPQLRSWHVRTDRIHVIENWAPIDELPQHPRRNAWAAEQGLGDGTVVLYSGTLGLKHNPELLLALARRYQARPDVVVAVVSEGIGAEWLRTAAARERLDNLRILPFQPYDRLPEVLATADVLVAILEADAGAFSVPSKVLSYLCAGRPVLAAIPSANLAARTIAKAGAGIVVEPGDVDAFVDAGVRLVEQPDLRDLHGRRARTAAERTFHVRAIGDRFEAVLRAAHAAVGSIPPTPQSPPGARS